MKSPNQIIRIINKFLSIAITLLIIAMATDGHQLPTLNETILLLFFPVTVVAGFFVAWKKERLGGFISVAGLAGFYLCMYFQRGAFPGGPYFFLFSVPAFIFLLLSFTGKQIQKQ